MYIYILWKNKWNYLWVCVWVAVSCGRQVFAMLVFQSDAAPSSGFCNRFTRTGVMCRSATLLHNTCLPSVLYFSFLKGNMSTESFRELFFFFFACSLNVCLIMFHFLYIRKNIFPSMLFIKSEPMKSDKFQNRFSF